MNLIYFWISISLTFSLSSLSMGIKAESVTDHHQDPFLWLEEVEGEKALQWVREQNEKTLQEFQHSQGSPYKDLEGKALEILNSQERIPYGTLRNGYIYNFWQDQQHVKGIWRRTTLEEYEKEKPHWEILLDIDKLSKKENESWVYKGASCLPPKYNRCLISLSRGGKDATEVREFDISSKRFLPDGFFLKESKNSLDWVDENTLFVGTDFGPGTLTDSGYPRQAKVWKRGQPLENSSLLLEGSKEDVSVFAYSHFGPEGVLYLAGRSLDFYHRKYWLLKGPPNWDKTELALPSDAEISNVFYGHLIIRLKSDYVFKGLKKSKTLPAGSLLSINTKEADLSSPDLIEKADLIFSPQERLTIEDVQTTKDTLLLVVLDNVRAKILKLDFLKFFNKDFSFEEIPLPANGSASLISTNNFHNKIFFNYENFLNPSQLHLIDTKENKEQRPLKTLPQLFGGDDFQVTQQEAVSKDGTKIPYYIIASKKMKGDGKNPTLLYGYGGFEVSLLPSYMPLAGKLWLEKGGVYVQANIRGGGEFGPKWHQAALKKNRHKAFEDFIAVAEDLIQKQITSPQHLGIMGGSNGGLLVGATFTQRPELFNAVVCQVPLLDMIRYSKLLAGASWIGEYGDPEDPDMLPTLLSYSPYHNLKKEIKYPEVFFVTSTKDDRVHPGHARKMAAKMLEQGHRIFYYEIIQGGHGGSTNNIEKAKRLALEYSYLLKKLSY